MTVRVPKVILFNPTNHPSDQAAKFDVNLHTHAARGLMKVLIAIFVSAATIAITMPARAGELSNELLMSSAWCSFSYNQVTGYSNTTRVRFSSNGTYSTGGRAEGYSSGSGGTYASQNDSSASGQWKLAKGELYMSEGYGELGLVQTVVKRNSSGYPIITANGVEYSQCQ